MDRFAFEWHSTGEFIGPKVVHGVFGLASLNFSITTTCRAQRCGPFCEALMPQQGDKCVCEPGYTGEFCFHKINQCENVTCINSNMICVNHGLSYKCVCVPGFTGIDCRSDINECKQETCNSNGKCVNDIGSFHCECGDEYTGRFCESKMDRFTIEITFHSFFNPGGKCADVGEPCSSGRGCCDDQHCRFTSCDYQFLYCKRAAGTPVSLLRSERRGQCQYLETSSHTSTETDSFATSVYGVKNPILFTQTFMVRENELSYMYGCV